MMQSEQALRVVLGVNEAREVGSSLILYKNRGKGDTKINLKGFSYGC